MSRRVLRVLELLLVVPLLWVAVRVLDVSGWARRKVHSRPAITGYGEVRR